MRSSHDSNRSRPRLRDEPQGGLTAARSLAHMSSAPPPLASSDNRMLFRYRGTEGMVAWAFHRISGVAIWLFVLLHVLDIYLAGGNPKVYDDILQFYASAPGRIMEVLLGAALLYHALNGI